MEHSTIISLAMAAAFLIGVLVGWALKRKFVQMTKEVEIKLDKKKNAIELIKESDHFFLTALSPDESRICTSVFVGSMYSLKLMVCCSMSSSVLTEEAFIEAVRVYTEDKEKRENSK